MEELEPGVTPEEVAEVAESTPAETEEIEETPEDPSAEPPKSKGVQKRIDELVRQREEERRRAERYETMLHEMYAKQQKPPEPEAVKESPKPTREQFDFDEEKYIEALTDWKLEQVEARRAAEAQRREQEQRHQTFYQSFEEKRVGTITQGREKFGDFDDVVLTLPANVMTAELAAAIFETDKPSEVAYYLGKNRDEAQRIAGLPPLRKAVELGVISAKLAAPPVKKATSAPPPITPVGARAAAGSEPDPGKDPDAWLAWERARVKKLGRPF